MGKEGKRRLISKLQQEKDQTVAARVVANEAEMADRMTEDEGRDRVNLKDLKGDYLKSIRFLLYFGEGSTPETCYNHLSYQIHLRSESEQAMT